MEQESILHNILNALSILCEPSASSSDYREADEFLRSVRQQPTQLLLFCQFLTNKDWFISKGPFHNQLLSFMFQFAGTMLEDWIRTKYDSFDKQHRQNVVELTKQLLIESCNKKVNHSAIEKCCKAASCCILLFSLDSDVAMEELLEHWWNTFVELGKEQHITPLMYLIFLEEVENIPSYGSGEDAERRAWLKNKASKVCGDVSSELYRASLEDNHSHSHSSFPISSYSLKKDCIYCLKSWNVYVTRGSTADILCSIFEDADLIYEVADALSDDVGRGGVSTSSILQTCSSLLSLLKAARKVHANSEYVSMVHAALEVAVSIVEANTDLLIKQENFQYSDCPSEETDKVAAVLELCDLLMFGLQSGIHNATLAALEGVSYFANSFYHLKVNGQIGSHCNIEQLYIFFQECFQHFIYICTASNETILFAINNVASKNPEGDSSVEEFQQLRETTFEAAIELAKAVGDVSRMIHFFDEYWTTSHSYLSLESAFFVLTGAASACIENTKNKTSFHSDMHPKVQQAIVVQSTAVLFQFALQVLYENSPNYLKIAVLRLFNAFSSVLLEESLENTLFQPIMNILPLCLKTVPREASILLRTWSYSSPKRLLPYAEALLQAMDSIDSNFSVYKPTIEALARMIASMENEEERFRSVYVILQPCLSYLETTMQSLYSQLSVSQDPRTIVEVLSMISVIFSGLDEPRISCRVICDRLENFVLLGHHFASHELIAPELCKVFVQGLECNKADSHIPASNSVDQNVVIQILNILQSIFAKSDGEACWIHGCIQLIPLLDPNASNSQECVLQVVSGVWNTCHRCISEYSISGACERQDLIAECCRLSEILVLYYPTILLSCSEQIFPILLLGFYLSDANACMSSLRFWSQLLESWNQLDTSRFALDEKLCSFVPLLLQGIVYAVGGGIPSRLIRYLCNLLLSFCQWIALFRLQSSLSIWIQQAIESSQPCKFTVEMRKAFESMLLGYVNLYSQTPESVSKGMFRCFVSDICRVGRGEMMDDILYAYFR
ncbi:hypothetical protein GpartN1_g2795.t1 [Galdieria partita]|uniref:Uncharacterized protein n=1 Tax=Galdieria partita TaxID=83374 RepID=A0A9C7UPK4_9RHOD|nr:hypothetical protein GpartN1_g2795.t1 [Galdieria partita]